MCGIFGAALGKRSPLLEHSFDRVSTLFKLSASRGKEAAGFALANEDSILVYKQPIPADTLFVPQRLAQADCALAMYHDQGLPVLKFASFGRGVNVTLGLPFVRTSVDHGTALDLAGTGRADAGSLLEAAKLAIELASPA